MLKSFNKYEGLIGLVGLIMACIFFFFSSNKIYAAIILILTVIVVGIVYFFDKKKTKDFNYIQKIVRVLFIDDKDCQIVTNLKRNDFEVRKIDDVLSPAKDTDVKWANIIFVDYKDIGKKLFGQKEGLGLISELKRVYGDEKRYIIYSSVQDFDGLVEFPYIRKNASYDEFISLITTEGSKL